MLHFIYLLFFFFLGMVLIRSDTGQLMLVSQQALAQAQAQGLVPKSSNVTTTVRPQTSQVSFVFTYLFLQLFCLP